MAATMTKTCPYCVEEIHSDAIKCKHCGSWLTTPPQAGHRNGQADPYFGASETKFPTRRLMRTSGAGAMWFGVCGGIARTLGVDPTLVRVAFAVAAFFTAILPGLVLYLALTLIIPSDTDTNA